MATHFGFDLAKLKQVQVVVGAVLAVVVWVVVRAVAVDHMQRSPWAKC